MVEIDEAGLHYPQWRLRVPWSEVVDIEATTADGGSGPVGFGVRLLDGDAVWRTSGHGRLRWLFVGFPAREWLFIPEQQLGLPVEDVLTAALRLSPKEGRLPVVFRRARVPA